MDVVDEAEADVWRRAEAQYSTARAKVAADIRRRPNARLFTRGLRNILQQTITADLSAEAIEQVKLALVCAFTAGRIAETAFTLGRLERQQSNGARKGFVKKQKAKADLWRNAGAPIYMKERGQLLGAGAKPSQSAVAQLIIEHCKKNDIECPDAPTIVRWIIEMDKKQRAAVAQHVA